jgi:hypothetical protein
VSNVFGTVRDPSGNIYSNALIIASFIGQSAVPGAGPYVTGGVPQGQFETIVPGVTDSFGAFAMPLAGNDTITPTPSQWKFTVVSNTTPPVSFAVLITITGASQDISAALQAAAAPIIAQMNFGSITVTSLIDSGPASVAGALAANGGVTTTAAALTVNKPVDATTGFRIAGAAPSGHLLLGNGTNYIDAATLPVASVTAPTGTGYAHVTAGAFDPASKLISLTAAADVAANQGTATTVLHGNAAGQPSFGAVVLTSDVSGVLPTANGGTGQNSSATFPTTGVVVTEAATETLTAKRVTPRQVAMADAAAVTPTSDTADINTLVSTQVAGTLTVNAPSGTPTDGQKLVLRLKSTNAQTYSFNATYAFSTTVTAPTTLAAGKTDYLGLMWDATNTKWDVCAVDQGH